MDRAKGQFMEMEREIRNSMEPHLDGIVHALRDLETTSSQEEMARQFLLKVIEGKGEEASDALSLKMLHGEMSMGELVSTMGRLLKRMELEGEVMDGFQKLVSIHLAIVSEKMFHHFLRAVSSITGMSEDLLRNFARLQLKERSSVRRKDEEYAG